MKPEAWWDCGWVGRLYEGTEEAESAQLRAMSHQGIRISSLTKTHRHQRDGVGVSGRTRGRSANTPPRRCADSQFQTWQLVFWQRPPRKSTARPCTMWLTVIICSVCGGRFALLSSSIRLILGSEGGIREGTPGQRCDGKHQFNSGPCLGDPLVVWLINTQSNFGVFSHTLQLKLITRALMRLQWPNATSAFVV